jgi:hypothetical protein
MLQNNAAREQRTAYSAAVAEQDRALVRELWAIRDNSNQAQVQRIAERSGLPVHWLEKAPAVKGERGLEKLLEEEVEGRR